MNSKNEVFEYLIDRLRQQVGSNPYKQQCEDMAHEVRSLKNQLRDMSAQIKDLHLALVKATGDVEACQSAARAAENAHFLFQGDKPNDSEVRAICSPKRLGKQEK